MIFKGKKKQEVYVDYKEEEFLDKFRGMEIPILILDERWLHLFNDTRKTEKISQLERELRELFVEQAKLASKLEEAEKTKQQLMERIVKNMNVAQISDAEAKKQEKSQEYIYKIKEEIKELEDEYERIPEIIKECNEELMRESLRVCYRTMEEHKENMEKQEALVREAEQLLAERQKEKEYLKKENEQMYTFMHRVFGKKIVEIFDAFDK